MTSTPFTSGARSTDGHPDVAEISALNEELLPPDRSSALHAHLASCGLCADVLASLEEIRGTLGTLPGPAGMPADVAGRIDAALAAEALLSSSARDSSVVSRETDEAYNSGRYARPTTEQPSGHGVGVVSRETGASRRPADRPAGRPGGGSSGPGRHRPARRVRRWRSAILAGAAAVVALGVGGVVMQSMSGSAPSTAESGPDKSERATAGSALEKHVQGLLAKNESGGSTEGTGGSPSRDIKTKESQGDAPLAGGATSVPSCVRAGIDRTDSPLAVDEEAPYKGGTAYLVVLPHEDDPKRVDAYLVDRSCLGDQGGGPGDVLTRHTYTRR
ncbi:hypothetical protein DB35_03025 [Streptomyces abyssalis]|uniref:Zinc-finger domain-containing protein n=1 Tax=Streptomyces abyssalis TaxID=933944 RepID=A0A1E7JPT6_9ACTN|nr:hypothetical protein [Streptomyces abyssalis]OEU90266.1 hypothetical protein AN215_12145 [Streptomyces abyssalis]OEU95001.1 hypothetical protein DB35_03025 [Streptomyces abyssalis]OEV28937.1 hypothetical protein AN219_19395 [Streptomyces nanshensis]